MNATQVAEAAARWRDSGQSRLTDRVLLRFGLYQALRLGKPLQFHVGFGDRDRLGADRDALHRRVAVPGGQHHRRRDQRAGAADLAALVEDRRRVRPVVAGVCSSDHRSRHGRPLCTNACRSDHGKWNALAYTHARIGDFRSAPRAILGVMRRLALLVGLVACGDAPADSPDAMLDASTDASWVGRCGTGLDPCADHEYCDFADTCGGVGHCVPRTFCSGLTPRCGCDGTVYDTTCDAAAAGTDVGPTTVCATPAGSTSKWKCPASRRW